MLRPRILVFGTGSIGIIYTYFLDAGGAAVSCVCRSNYDIASRQGFIINSTLFGVARVKPAAVLRDASEAAAVSESSFDFVVVASKATPGSSPTTAELIKPAIGPNTAIVLLQNGICIEEEYATLFPSNPIVSGVIYLPATQTSPGTVTHKEIEELRIGTYPSAAPRAHKAAAEGFARILTAGGATVILYDDLQPERWSKLIINAAWNPTSALTRCRDAQFIASSSGATVFVREVMLEVLAVAKAEGIKGLDESTVDYQLGRAKERELPGVEPSMLADVLAGRNMEVEAILGNAIRVARATGVNVPRLESLYVLALGLHSAGARARGEVE